MQSYGAVDGGGNKAYGYPPQQAPPYPSGYQQPAAAQGNYPAPPYPPAQGQPGGAPPYPPAQGQPGGVEGPDDQQLPPNVKIDSLPMSDGGEGSSMPSAPSMDAIRGYGQFDNSPLAPPSYDDAMRRQEPTNRPVLNQVPVISEAQARTALLEHCAQHCCYGKGAAENMVVTNMTSSSAYHSYGAVDGGGNKAYGYPPQQAPPYPSGYQQPAAAQGNYPAPPYPPAQGQPGGAPPYPPAQGQPGGVEGPDDQQLPPNVKIDSLPMSDGGEGSSMPSAPSMDAIRGYGQFDNSPLAPPSYDDAMRRQEPTNRPVLNQVPVISEAQARTALLEHCAQHCCYGKGAAENMVVTNMTSSSAYHYVLESFGESRSTAWTSTPYIGGPIDTPMNGPAPMPWDIPVYAGEKFKDGKTVMEVPHTANIKTCHKCLGIGRLRCHHCFGSGHTHCSCHGGYTTINNERRPCSFCHGSGRRRCTWCHGCGHIRCTVCNGHRQLKWFIQLTVKWTNHVDDYILERTAMPDKYIRKVQGQTVFEEEMPWVFPVNQCPEPTVNKASAELVEKHRRDYQSERILLQRHKIRIVPVTEVHSSWKSKNFTFYVHGLEHQVYSEDYPQQCCCGCTII